MRKWTCPECKLGGLYKHGSGPVVCPRCKDTLVEPEGKKQEREALKRVLKAAEKLDW